MGLNELKWAGINLWEKIALEDVITHYLPT